MSNGGYQQIPIPRPAWAGELSAAAEGLMFGLAIGTAFIRLSWGLFPLANAAADTIVLSLALWLGSAIVFAAAAATGAGAIHRSIEGPSPYGGGQVRRSPVRTSRRHLRRRSRTSASGRSRIRCTRRA